MVQVERVPLATANGVQSPISVGPACQAQLNPGKVTSFEHNLHSSSWSLRCGVKSNSVPVTQATCGGRSQKMWVRTVREIIARNLLSPGRGEGRVRATPSRIYRRVFTEFHEVPSPPMKGEKVAEGRMRGLFAGSDAIKYLTALGEGYKKAQLFLERS